MAQGPSQSKYVHFHAVFSKNLQKNKVAHCIVLVSCSLHVSRHNAAEHGRSTSSISISISPTEQH